MLMSRRLDRERSGAHADRSSLLLRHHDGAVRDSEAQEERQWEQVEASAARRRWGQRVALGGCGTVVLVMALVAVYFTNLAQNLQPEIAVRELSIALDGEDVQVNATVDASLAPAAPGLAISLSNDATCVMATTAFWEADRFSDREDLQNYTGHAEDEQDGNPTVEFLSVKFSVDSFRSVDGDTIRLSSSGQPSTADMQLLIHAENWDMLRMVAMKAFLDNAGDLKAFAKNTSTPMVQVQCEVPLQVRVAGGLIVGEKRISFRKRVRLGESDEDEKGARGAGETSKQVAMKPTFVGHRETNVESVRDLRHAFLESVRADRVVLSVDLAQWVVTLFGGFSDSLQAVRLRTPRYVTTLGGHSLGSQRAQSAWQLDLSPVDARFSLSRSGLGSERGSMLQQNEPYFATLSLQCVETSDEQAAGSIENDVKDKQMGAGDLLAQQILRSTRSAFATLHDQLPESLASRAAPYLIPQNGACVLGLIEPIVPAISSLYLEGGLEVEVETEGTSFFENAFGRLHAADISLHSATATSGDADHTARRLFSAKRPRYSHESEGSPQERRHLMSSLSAADLRDAVEEFFEDPASALKDVAARVASSGLPLNVPGRDVLRTLGKLVVDAATDLNAESVPSDLEDLLQSMDLGNLVSWVASAGRWILSHAVDFDSDMCMAVDVDADAFAFKACQDHFHWDLNDTHASFDGHITGSFGPLFKNISEAITLAVSFGENDDDDYDYLINVGTTQNTRYNFHVSGSFFRNFASSLEFNFPRLSRDMQFRLKAGPFHEVLSVTHSPLVSDSPASAGNGEEDPRQHKKGLFEDFSVKVKHTHINQRSVHGTVQMSEFTVFDAKFGMIGGKPSWRDSAEAPTVLTAELVAKNGSVVLLQDWARIRFTSSEPELVWTDLGTRSPFQLARSTASRFTAAVIAEHVHKSKTGSRLVFNISKERQTESSTSVDSPEQAHAFSVELHADVGFEHEEDQAWSRSAHTLWSAMAVSPKSREDVPRWAMDAGVSATYNPKWIERDVLHEPKWTYFAQTRQLTGQHQYSFAIEGHGLPAISREAGTHLELSVGQDTWLNETLAVGYTGDYRVLARDIPYDGLFRVTMFRQYGVNVSDEAIHLHMLDPLNNTETVTLERGQRSVKAYVYRQKSIAQESDVFKAWMDIPGPNSNVVVRITGCHSNRFGINHCTQRRYDGPGFGSVQFRHPSQRTRKLTPLPSGHSQRKLHQDQHWHSVTDGDVNRQPSQSSPMHPDATKKSGHKLGVPFKTHSDRDDDKYDHYSSPLPQTHPGVFNPWPKKGEPQSPGDKEHSTSRTSFSDGHRFPWDQALNAGHDTTARARMPEAQDANEQLEMLLLDTPHTRSFAFFKNFSMSVEHKQGRTAWNQGHPFTVFRMNLEANGKLFVDDKSHFSANVATYDQSDRPANLFQALLRRDSTPEQDNITVAFAQSRAEQDDEIFSMLYRSTSIYPFQRTRSTHLLALSLEGDLVFEERLEVSRRMAWDRRGAVSGTMFTGIDFLDLEVIHEHRSSRAQKDPFIVFHTALGVCTGVQLTGGDPETTQLYGQGYLNIGDVQLLNERLVLSHSGLPNNMDAVLAVLSAREPVELAVDHKHSSARYIPFHGLASGVEAHNTAFRGTNPSNVMHGRVHTIVGVSKPGVRLSNSRFYLQWLEGNPLINEKLSVELSPTSTASSPELKLMLRHTHLPNDDVVFNFNADDHVPNDGVASSDDEFDGDGRKRAKQQGSLVFQFNGEVNGNLFDDNFVVGTVKLLGGADAVEILDEKLEVQVRGASAGSTQAKGRDKGDYNRVHVRHFHGHRTRQVFDLKIDTNGKLVGPPFGERGKATVSLKLAHGTDGTHLFDETLLLDTTETAVTTAFHVHRNEDGAARTLWGARVRRERDSQSINRLPPGPRLGPNCSRVEPNCTLVRLLEQNFVQDRYAMSPTLVLYNDDGSIATQMDANMGIRYMPGSAMHHALNMSMVVDGEDELGMSLVLPWYEASDSTLTLSAGGANKFEASDFLMTPAEYVVEPGYYSDDSPRFNGVVRDAFASMTNMVPSLGKLANVIDSDVSMSMNMVATGLSTDTNMKKLQTCEDDADDSQSCPWSAPVCRCPVEGNDDVSMAGLLQQQNERRLRGKNRDEHTGQRGHGKGTTKKRKSRRSLLFGKIGEACECKPPLEQAELA